MFQEISRFIARAVLILIAVMRSPVVNADQFGDFGYTINGMAVTITNCSGLSGVVAIPDTIDGLPVNCIGTNAFRYRHLVTNVAIPNSVVRISDSAFYSCTNLTDVTIPDSVTNVAYGAFALCFNLTNVVIPSSVTRLGGAAFEACYRLSSVTIPGSVTCLESSTFRDCTGLRSVRIMDGVASIGNSVFACCDNLREISIPDSVTNIGNSALYSASITNITLSTNLAGIGAAAFCWCTNLRSITIPIGVTNIDDRTFASCTGLTNVALPKNLKRIGIRAFGNCSSLIGITLPDGLQRIEEYAFTKCSSLSQLTIPTFVVYRRAFQGCSNLVNLVILPGIRWIGEDAFSFCPALANVTLPEGLESIAAGAFYGASLTNATIPSSVTYLWGFCGCPHLKGVFFKGDVPSQVGFWDSTNVIAYYLPGTTGWSNSLAGRPAVLWNPAMPASDPSFGVRSNRFGFTITGTANIPIVLEATTNLANSPWVVLQAGVLTNGLLYFSDSQWTSNLSRFYRIRSP